MLLDKNSSKRENQTKLKIGIIGAGLFAARYHIPNVAQSGIAEVSAICRASLEKAKEMSGFYKIPSYYSDYRDMLEHEILDGVIIASPPSFHFKHAKACIERSLPVLLEKPMVLNIKDGFELKEIAEAHNIPVVVGYNRHFRNECVQAKRMIDAGAIGRIQSITARWSVNVEWAISGKNPPAESLKSVYYKVDGKPNFRGVPELSGGGAFIDAGSHAAESILWYAGKRPLKVKAFMTNRDCPVDCDTSLISVFEDDIIVSCTLLGAEKAFNGNEIWVAGSEGALYLKNRELFYQANNQPAVKIENLPDDSSSTENFINVINQAEDVKCSITDGLRADIFIKSIYDSAEKSGSDEKITEWI